MIEKFQQTRKDYETELQLLRHQFEKSSEKENIPDLRFQEQQEELQAPKDEIQLLQATFKDVDVPLTVVKLFIDEKINIFTSTIEEKVTPKLTLQEQVSTVHMPPEFNFLNSFQKSTIYLAAASIES